jgi:hypothetical protein
VVVVPARPARVVAIPARPARVVAIPASGSPMAPVPVSGSSAPVVAAVPIPVIAPPRVPEFSWAPLREGPGLCLRLGCDAHSGEAHGDSYGEYGCNKTCKRSNIFHVWLGTPGTWAGNLRRRARLRGGFPANSFNPAMTCKFRRMSGARSPLTNWAPEQVSALQHRRADGSPANAARLTRAPVHVCPGPVGQV